MYIVHSIYARKLSSVLLGYLITLYLVFEAIRHCYFLYINVPSLCTFMSLLIIV